MLSKVSALAAAVTGVLDALVLLDVVELSGEQIAGISGAILAVGAAIGAFLDPRIPFGPRE